MLNGRVTKLRSKTEGGDITFGFIKDEAGTEYFFHGGAMDQMAGVKIQELREGQRVQFEMADHPKGPRAIGVRLTVN